MAKKESAVMHGEEYLKGRRAGVEGTHGEMRKGLAEKTVVGKPDEQSDSGSVQGDLSSAARSIYEKAVKNRGDDQGDKALTER
jgi:hypothetical protein